MPSLNVEQIHFGSVRCLQTGLGEIITTVEGGAHACLVHQNRGKGATSAPAVLQHTNRTVNVSVDGYKEKMGWCNRLKGIGRQKPDTCLTQGLPSLCGSALQEVGDEHQDQDLPSSTIGCLFGDHERLLGLRVENEFGSSPPLLEIWVWSVLSSLRASVPDQCWGGIGGCLCLEKCWESIVETHILCGSSYIECGFTEWPWSCNQL